MVDVFVIGGGPAGLTSAIALRRKGLRVVVADACRPPIDKACGEGLMPDGLAALGRLGVSIPNAGSFPFRGIALVNGPDRAEAHFPGGAAALGVRRTTLHHVLVEQAAREGVEMMWGTNVSNIGQIPARFIVGADGSASRVRSWAGLEASWRNRRRFGFRRHYRVRPWTDCMEIHWGPGCQIYATPVAPDEVCIALISKDPKLRLDDALPAFPRLRRLLDSGEILNTERGSITATRRLRRVYRGNVVLAGDASGSVDAITGEGLCLAFQQSAALADAVAAGDLRQYARQHRRLSRRPTWMADFMLMLGESRRTRSRAIRTLAANPDLFARMLAVHLGGMTPLHSFMTAATLAVNAMSTPAGR